MEVTLPFYMIPRSCINSSDHQTTIEYFFLTWNDDVLEYKYSSWMNDKPVECHEKCELIRSKLYIHFI